MTSLFVWGSEGTGKTLMLMEALKIKLSKLLSPPSAQESQGTEEISWQIFSEYEEHWIYEVIYAVRQAQYWV